MDDPKHLSPDKRSSRVDHESKRGKRLTTLGSLSRELPSSEELQSYLEILEAEQSHRSAAIMAAALVEQALYVAVTSRMADPGESIRQSWFDAPNAPFQTFAAKIKLGRALAIYGPKMEKVLNSIKDIRNVFAHRSTPIDFTNPTIENEVKKLNDRPMIGRHPARTRFFAICIATAKLLIDDAFENGGKELVVRYP